MTKLHDIKKEILAKADAGEITPQQAVQEFERRVMPGRTYQPKDKNERLKQYATDKELRLRARQSSVPFISAEFNGLFKLSQGLVLVGGVSGQGKSTTAANIVAGFLANSDDKKKAIVITNEETSEAVINRVACIQLGYSFFELQKGRMLADKLNEVTQLAAVSWVFRA